jgi:hypothetical protein
MNTDSAVRLVMSPEEARSWLSHLHGQGVEAPMWALEWDGMSSVWLEEVES